jgi:nucleotide-binding universal stress UspA family protein
MGAESTRAFERFLLGGKTISAVKQLDWPLIVVPPDVKFTTIKKIGLACDFKNVVETIPIKEIKNLVNEFDAELYVLHVSDEIGDRINTETVEESASLQDLIGELKPKYHFIAGTDVEKGIIGFAENNKLDLLIIIPKKHDLVSKMFVQSFSKRLVLHSHVAVMAIHE